MSVSSQITIQGLNEEIFGELKVYVLRHRSAYMCVVYCKHKENLRSMPRLSYHKQMQFEAILTEPMS